jgi:hypothetical protein
MLNVLAFVISVCVAADISRRIYLSRLVFIQLCQPTSVAWMVWLYPLPFLLPFFGRSFFIWILYRIPLGMCFFIPALMSARATRKCFEVSGDGNVKPALAAVDMATTAGIMGIMGILAFAGLCWAFGWPKAYVE